MPRLIQALPKLRTHKATGRAVVTLDGQDIYLGPAGSLIAGTQYDRIVSEWLANGRALPSAPQVRKVSEIIARFWEHAQRILVLRLHSRQVTLPALSNGI